MSGRTEAMFTLQVLMLSSNFLLRSDPCDAAHTFIYHTFHLPWSRSISSLTAHTQFLLKMFLKLFEYGAHVGVFDYY